MAKSVVAPPMLLATIAAYGGQRTSGVGLGRFYTGKDKTGLLVDEKPYSADYGIASNEVVPRKCFRTVACGVVR